MTSRLETRPAAGKRGWVGLMAAGCALLPLCAVCGASLAGLRLFGQRSSSASPPSVEYVLDASPRMALPAEAGAGTRLSVAEAVLAEIVRPSDPAATAGFRVFGTGKLADACVDTDLLVPLARASQAKIASSLLTVNPGSKPDAAMTAAVVGALRDLAGTQGRHTLVVVTGGSDSCNPQAGQLINAEAQKAGIDYQLFVVGYFVPDDQGLAISGLVDSTSNGHYVDARSQAELKTVLTAIQQYVDNPQTITVASVLATAAALPSQTAVSTATGTPPAISTASPTPTPSPTRNLAPRVLSFVARFDPVQRSTFYSVTVATASTSATAPSVSYAWSNTNKCGEFKAANSPIAEWHHPDAPGICPNVPVHPGVITVVIRNQFGATQCDYAGGSAPGNSAQCQEIK